MRIAIITVYDSIINFGSFLQAYSMSEVLKAMGHEAFFVRRMSDEEILWRFDKLAIKQNTVPPNKKLRLFRQLKRDSIKKIEINNNKYRFEQSKKDWNELELIDQKDVTSSNIDLIICGSDEIWNVHNDDIDIPFYICDWTGEQIRKIAYAISVGDTEPQEVDHNFKKAISRFEYLLPRDNMSQKLFDKLLHERYEIVCDPTILYGKSNFAIKQDNEYGNYLLVYSYGLSKKEKTYIKKFAKEKNLKIISPCMYSDIADEVMFTSALEFHRLFIMRDLFIQLLFTGQYFH